MAKFLCRTSEEKLWTAISESCQRYDTVLDRDLPGPATIRGRGFASSLWNVEIATSPLEEPMDALLAIQVNRTSKGDCFFGGSLAVWLGALILGLCLFQYGQSGWAVCALLLGIVGLSITLLFSLLTDRYVRTFIAKMLYDLGSDIDLQKLEPFEVRQSWLDRVIVIPMAIISWLLLAVLAGSLFGTLLLVFTGPLLFAWLIVKPRLTSWRSVLHGIHAVGTRVCFMAFVSAIVVFVPGALAYCKAYHRSEFRNVTIRTVDNLFRLAFTDSWGWSAPPETVAGEMADALALPTENVLALAIVVLMGMMFFMGMAFRGILGGMERWRLANLSERPPVGPVVPLSESPGRLGSVLVGINAILSGPIYWFTAIVSIDAISYLLFGRALMFLPIGWSLEFFKSMLNIAGVPELTTSILVSVMIVLTSLPGVALMVMALNRVIRGLWSTLTYLLPADRSSREMEITHEEWLQRTCLQVEIRPPRFRVIDSRRPILSSEHSLIPFLSGRIIVSSACCELFDASEIRALLAHEIHHLKYAARQIQALKAMSSLLLCPVYYLLILYDFTHNEHEADTFAVSTTEDVETFRIALVKLQVASSIRREVRGGFFFERCFAWLRSRSRFFQALPLYFNDSILGAAYPTLQERFAYIDRLRGGGEKQTA